MKNWGDGAWHNATTLLIAAFLLVVPFGLSDSKFLLLSVGALLALFINPDLDQDGLTLAETLLGKVLGTAGESIGKSLNSPTLANVLKRIGKGVGLFFAGCWMAFWALYTAFMPHRSFFSHFPVVGTTIRVLWIAGVMLVLRHSIYILTGKWVDADLTFYTIELAILFIGLCIADFGHYARDMKWLVLERHLGVNKQEYS